MNHLPGVCRKLPIPEMVKILLKKLEKREVRNYAIKIIYAKLQK